MAKIRLSAAKIERHVITLTNRQRRNHRVPPVARVRLIGRVARNHARDMVRRHYAGHRTKGTPLQPWHRGFRAGLNVALSENIGSVMWRPPNLTIYGGGNVRVRRHNPEMAAAYALVRQWMESPPHRHNMLLERRNQIGIGIAFDHRTGTIHGVMNLAYREPLKSKILDALRGLLEYVLGWAAIAAIVGAIAAAIWLVTYVHEALAPALGPIYEALVPVASMAYDTIMQAAAPVIALVQNTSG